MPQVSKNTPRKEVSDRIYEIYAKSLPNSLLDELLTKTEKIMIAKRISIAYLLAQNYDYRTISQVLKVSTSTVGSIGAKYKYSESLTKIINQLLENEVANKQWRKLAQDITGIFAIPGSKAGAWKSLNKSLKSMEKPF